MSEETFDRLYMPPNGWLVKTIDDLAIRVGSGVTPTGGSEVYSDSGVIFVRSQNVTNSGLLLDDVAFIDTFTHEKMRNSELHPFDVLLNITGASIGRCCVFPQEIGSANVNQHVCVIRLASPNYMEAKFLALLFVSPLGQIQIFRLNAGGNREGLNYQQIRSMCFSFPPLPHQRKISKILTTVDNLIEKTEALIAKYQSIKQGMMHDLFTRGVDANGKLRPPQSEAPELYKQSELGWIPKDWEVMCLGEVASKIQDGTHFSPKSTHGPFRYVTSKNIRFGYFDLDDSCWISSEEHKEIFKRCDVSYGDVLLTKDGANTGNACLNTIHEPFSLLSSVAVVRMDGVRSISEFVLQYFISSFCQQRFKDLMSGNAITRLTLEKIKSFSLPFPKLVEQKNISKRVYSLDLVAKENHSNLTKLKSIKTALMQDLLTGKVQVKPDAEDKELAHV